LQPESWINGIRILRPFLEISKSEIQQTLAQGHIQAFEDPSNRHPQFLRARLRETIFPRLNQEFGKQVQKSLATMGKEAQELTGYFNARLMPLLEHFIPGPWGIYLDLQTLMPESLLEIKYLLRLLCQQQGFFLSREIIEQAAQALQSNKANQCFEMGSHQIWIDRQCLFILSSPQTIFDDQSLTLSPGIFLWGNWKVNVSEDIYLPNQGMTSWKEGWKGRLESYVPIGNYQLGFKSPLDTKRMRKYWGQAKVPAFLYPYFPLIWGEREFCQEFLTGKSFCAIAEKAPCWRIELNFL
jgi:tRNA(Ile)-lysidine synthase